MTALAVVVGILGLVSTLLGYRYGAQRADVVELRRACHEQATTIERLREVNRLAEAELTRAEEAGLLGTGDARERLRRLIARDKPEPEQPT